MDSVDAKWYDDVPNRTLNELEASLPSNMSDIQPLVPNPMIELVSTRRPRRLVRFNSEQAMQLFSQ